MLFTLILLKTNSEENYLFIHEIINDLIEDNNKHSTSQYLKYLISLHRKLEKDLELNNEPYDSDSD